MSNILNKKLAVISLDFLKAFGKVDWAFVLSVLHKFCYRYKIIHMIQVAYTNIQSKIKINGLLSEPFTFMREVHQGCSLSMLLYIISIKVLAILIDVDTKINGVQTGEKENINFYW